MKRVARFENGGWELGLVGTIGVVLCLEAECRLFAIGRPTLALCAIEVVACVELHTWLVRPHFQSST